MTIQDSTTTKRRFQDLTGKRFFRWEVLSFSGLRDNKRSEWVCRCDCGVVKVVLGSTLKCNKSKSCGCLQKEVASKTHTTHGQAKKNQKTNEYETWVGIKSRTLNPSHNGYEGYGARGISICERWLKSFQNFYDDMGPKPSPKHSIERLNNNGDYEPSNCVWATTFTQSRNKRNTVLLEYKGFKATLNDWSYIIGLDRELLWCRLRRGWTIAEVVSVPYQKYARRQK